MNWKNLYGLTNRSATCSWKVVLYFHGNAGNVYTQKRQYELFEKLWVCFFAVDYPWYGKSGGKIKHISDLYKTWDELVMYVRSLWIKDDDIRIWWYSLWWWIASTVAQKYSFSHLVLQSTYTRLIEVAAAIYRMFPVKLLMKYDLESVETLKNYTWRLTVIHGTADRTVPYTHWSALYESYASEKQMVTFDGGHMLEDIGRISDELVF